VPALLFSGFKKSYHSRYKFDSNTEKDFSIILEQDSEVIKWLRPANNQFSIYYNHKSQNYNPDFVSETKDSIYLIEIKKEKDIETREVEEKAKSALEYCKNATEYTKQHGGKSWKYLLIPHDKVMLNMSFGKFVRDWEARQ
jgi:type III restriction enzyme